MRTLIILIGLVISAGPVFAQQASPYYELDEWLAKEKQLSPGDVELRNCDEGQTVFDTVRRSAEPGKKVCEVWRAERTIPAEPLRFSSGQVAKVAAKTVSETVMVPEAKEREPQVLVADETREVPESYMRYLVKPGRRD